MPEFAQAYATFATCKRQGQGTIDSLAKAVWKTSNATTMRLLRFVQRAKPSNANRVWSALERDGNLATW